MFHFLQSFCNRIEILHKILHDINVNPVIGFLLLFFKIKFYLLKKTFESENKFYVEWKKFNEVNSTYSIFFFLNFYIVKKNKTKI